MRTKHFHFPFLIGVSLGMLLGSCHKVKDEKEIANPDYKEAYSKALAFDSIGRLDSAYFYYNKAKLSCSSQEVRRKASALVMMSQIQNQFADYSGSQENCTEAFKVSGDDTYYHSSLNNILGISYKGTFDYEKALTSYNEVLKKTTKESEKTILQNNIAVVHLEQQQFSKAASVLEPLLNKKDLATNSHDKARVMDNLGYAYFKLQNPKALAFLKESLSIRDSLKNDFDTTASLMHLSEYYLKQNQQLSNDYALKAYEAATRANNPDDRIEALDFLIKNANSNEFKKYYSIHSTLNDSITKVRQTAKNDFAKIKFDSSKTIQELELQKTKGYLYLVLLILISALASYIIVAIRKKNRQKLKAISYETETRISKRIHDELANDVFNALTFAETQNLQDPNNKEALLENLDTIYARTRNISNENSEINTGKDYPKHLVQLLSQYESNSVNVIIHKITSIDWDVVKKEVKIALYRVLQELMVNMKKHSNCDVVILRFENQKSKIEVHYSDNGKGIKMLKSKKGLQNAENRILAIKGTITFDFETATGFKVKIEIPK